MTFNEFSNYMKENLSKYDVFYNKAMEYQLDKNSKRQKKWNDLRIEKEVDSMWKSATTNMYNQLSPLAKKEKMDIIEYIEKNNIIESINESMSEIDFNVE